MIYVPAPSHWYESDGTPAHTVKGKNGKERPTTLADARKMRLLPSVTNVLNVIGRPALENWKQERCILTAADMPRSPEETDFEYIRRVRTDALSSAGEAASFGSAGHRALERYHLDAEPIPPKYKEYVDPVLEWQADHELKVHGCEMRVSASHLGFAGTTDFIGEMLFGGEPYMVCGDYKFRKSNGKLPVYDTELLQIAAYAYAVAEGDLSLWRGQLVVISSTEPGKFRIVDFNSEDLTRGWEVFRSVLLLWKHLNNYDPCQN